MEEIKLNKFKKSPSKADFTAEQIRIIQPELAKQIIPES